MITRGIVYIAIGKEYEQLAAHTIQHSRCNTNLPICVITDVPAAQRETCWNQITDITFQECHISLEDNRRAKTMLYKYTPFDQTLYLDCDSVIQLPLGDIFDLLDTCDIVLAKRFHWNCDTTIPEVYLRAMRTCGVKLPLDAWHGAIFMFDKHNIQAQRFGDLWYENWVRTGKCRDLPALVCTTRYMREHNGLRVSCFPDNFFTLKPDVGSVIWHPQPGKVAPFFQRYNLPKWQPWNPNNYRTEKWNMVHENAALGKERELPDLPCATTGETCLTAYAFGDYAEYAPLLAFSTLWSYPEYAVKFFFNGPIPDNVHEALDYLRTQISPNIRWKDNYKLPTQLSTQHMAKEVQQAGKCVRWLIPGEEFSGYEYVYMADIDFIIIPEQPSMLTVHKDLMTRWHVPYSNPIRWNYGNRMSGLQMVKASDYFPSINTAMTPYREGKLGIPNVNNEQFLYERLAEASLLPQQAPMTMEEFDVVRPHHGFHLGLVRNYATPQYYKQLWQTSAAAALPIVTSPIFENILKHVHVPWVFTSIQRAAQYITGQTRISSAFDAKDAMTIAMHRTQERRKASRTITRTANKSPLAKYCSWSTRHGMAIRRR